MKAALFFICLCVLISPALALNLQGKLEQGGFAIGETTPDSTVIFKGRQLQLSPKGQFVIGFDRDEGDSVVLQVNGKDHVLSIAPRPWKIQRIDGLPDEKVTPPKDVLDRIARENALIKQARQTQAISDFPTFPFVMPAHGRISGVFGSQRILNGKPRSPHKGIDIAAPEGTPVVAAAAGIVVLTHTDMYYTGGTVIVDHGHGISTIYVHLKDVDVKPGQKLAAQEQLGTVGSTGRSTGPHLHFGVNWFSTAIDPAGILAGNF